MANGTRTRRPPPKKGAASGGMGFLGQKLGPLPVWGWLAVAVVAYVIFFRKKTTAAASPTGTTASTTQPSVTETLPTGTSYTGPAQYAPNPATGGGGGGSGGGGGNRNPGGPINTPGGAGSPLPGGGSSGPAYGTSTIGGQEYVTLGTLTASGGTFSGYNVAGGAPVYYLAPGSTTPQTDLSQSAVEALPGGTQVLTPAGYSGAVGSQPTQEKL